MISDSLYTKYRPKKFCDVYGQKYISEILRNQIKNKKFTHAYLFSGTRGTGKTTCARIFGKGINCRNNEDGNPCYECDMCNGNGSTILNLVELDAASNNSVDQIKSLIEELRYSNFSGGYKIYILDEVHMLSISAFNALLKTLEEPPENVIFILSTTEIKKIPQTVISRCQKFEFKNIESNEIANRLKYIIENENINIDEESIELISHIGNGSMRDSISILERVLFYTDNITITDVRNILGISSNESILKLLKSVFDKELKLSLQIISEIFDGGIDVRGFINSFRNIVRDLIFLKLDNTNFDLLVEKNIVIVERMKKIIDSIEINELTFLINGINKIHNEKFLSDIEYRINLEMFLISLLKKEGGYRGHEEGFKRDSFIRKSISSREEEFIPTQSKFDLNMWRDFLDYLKKTSLMVLYSLLQHGSVESVNENRILFKCNTEGILNRLNDVNTIKQIEDNLNKFFGEQINFEIFLNDKKIENSINERVKNFFGEDVNIENK